MKLRKTAVLTDTMSPDFYFPLWYRYYESQFGAESIHVMTLSGLKEALSGFSLGSVTEMEPSYDDGVRLAAISERVSELLQCNDYVIHVDTDEFLIPDPLKHESLSAYIETLELDYVSARGFEVFQHRSEPPLTMERPILVHQRRHAFALAAMNKTCITAVPLTWNRGFHHCSRPPQFDDVFLFHMKRADAAQTISWNAYLSTHIQNDEYARSYYQTPPEALTGFLSDLSGRPVEEGRLVMYRDEFHREFLDKTNFNEQSGLYEYAYTIETRNVAIPDYYAGLL